MAETPSKFLVLLEDDPFLQALAVGQLSKLKSEGIELDYASTADEARAIIEKRTPDLLLLDIMLPGKNGFDFLAELRANNKYKSMPVIIFSNLGQPDDIKRSKELGALSFHVKANTTLDEISDEVRHVLTPKK